MKKEDFILRALEKHGDKYDYSLLPDEFKSTDKVKLVCSQHGEFSIEANSHLSRGSGCNKCGNLLKNRDRLLASELKFFSESSIVHNGKYDYSKSIFVTSKTPLTIICPIHSEFKQSPYAHLSGQGCKKCADIQNGLNSRLTTDKFITKSIEVHGNVYDYSDVNYVTQKSLINIGCKSHGVFLMRAINHLNGQGCPTCGIEKAAIHSRLSLTGFIEKSIKVHGLKYDYKFSNYIKQDIPVKIVCPEHQEFYQKPLHHMQGSGCPSCSKGGYDGKKAGWFYIIKVTDDVIKFGITNNKTQRLKDLQRDSCFNLEYLHCFYFEDGKAPIQIENQVKDSFQTKVVSKADMKSGHTETTYYDNLPLILNIVDDFTNSLSY